MKIGLFLCFYGGSSDANDSSEAERVQALNDLIKSVGIITRFIYDDLRAKSPSRNGISKPEMIKEQLDRKMIDLEGKLVQSLKKCGPGVTRQRKQESEGIIGRANMNMPGSLQRPINLGMPALISADKRPAKPIDGQTLADTFLPFGGGYEHFTGASFLLNRVNVSNNLTSVSGDTDQGDDFGSPFNSFDHAVPDFNGGFGPDDFDIGSFDPLNALHYTDSYRRRRFAAGETVTKGVIRKKVRTLNKSFEPIEKFVSEAFVNCRPSRQERVKTKVAKAKARIQKVVHRQGSNLLNKQT